MDGMFPPGVKSITDEEAKAMLPVGPPLYDEDALTDRSERYVSMCAMCCLLVCGDDWEQFS